MRESGKLRHVYCHEVHEISPELISVIERCLNGTLSDLTVFRPFRWYLIFLGVTTSKTSSRKRLNKNLQPKACRKSFNVYISLKENTAMRTKSKWANLLWSSAKQFMTQWTALQITFNGPRNVAWLINQPTYEVSNEQSEITAVCIQKTKKNLIHNLCNNRSIPIPKVKEFTNSVT
jgi:hypothetical protein